MQRLQDSASFFRPSMTASDFAVSEVLDTLPVLVVEPSLDELLPLVGTLTAAGFQVTAAGTFSQARELLSSQPPSILVTTLRLGLYNGLHLVLRGKLTKPDMAALVTSPVADPVLQADAEAMGATFMLKPVTEQDLIAAALRTLYSSDPSVAPLRPPFERRVRERRACEVPSDPGRRVAERRRRMLSSVGGPVSAI